MPCSAPFQFSGLIPVVRDLSPTPDLDIGLNYLSCTTITPTFKLIHLCLLQAKPNEEVAFSFKVKNDGNEMLEVGFIQMAHTRLNFEINDHGLGFGAKRVILKPCKLYLLL